MQKYITKILGSGTATLIISNNERKDIIRGNVLVGRGINRAGEGVVRAGHGNKRLIIKTKWIFNAVPSFS